MKAALITGASSGIGAAIARELCQRGYHVVLTARRTERLERLARELSRGVSRAIAVTADVTRDGDIERAVALAVAEFGRLDLAVANAGFAVDGNFERLSLHDYRRQFETNVFGVLRTIYAALPELKKNQGMIAIVGSVAGYFSIPGNTAYSMSKAALLGLADGLRAELKESGVSVTHIQPGFIRTEITQVDRNGRWHESPKHLPPAWITMQPAPAARRMVNAILARKRQAIITTHGKALIYLQRHVPGLMRLTLTPKRVKKHKLEAP